MTEDFRLNEDGKNLTAYRDASQVIVGSEAGLDKAFELRLPIGEDNEMITTNVLTDKSYEHVTAIATTTEEELKRARTATAAHKTKESKANVIVTTSIIILMQARMTATQRLSLPLSSTILTRKRT